MTHTDVIWDEELLQSSNTHDGLLQQVSRSGEYLVAKARKPSAELVISQVVWDEELLQAELFNGMHCTDVIWDEEPNHGFGSHDLLQQHAEVMDDQMQGKQDVPIEILCESVLWDAIPADVDTHHGLLQQLAHSGYYFGETRKLISIEPVVEDLLTWVNGPISVLEPSVDSVHDVFVERHLENKAAVLTKQVEFMDPVTSKGDSHMMLAEMQNMPVVWDDALLHGLGSQKDLLQELAAGGEFLHDSERNLLNDEMLVYDEGMALAINPGCVVDHFSAECINCQCGALSTISEKPPGRPNAPYPGNCDTHVALSVSNQIYSWSRCGFSPWRCELNKRLLTAYSDRQSDENILCKFITPIVEFNFNEKRAMGRECLDGEKNILDTDHIASQVIFHDNVMLHGYKSQVQSKIAVRSRICANFNIEKMSELAGSRVSIDSEKAKGVIKVDTDKVLSHIGGLSHFLELCETSNADEASKLIAEILTHESGLLQYLEIDTSYADHGLDETLELDDQLSCEVLYGCNENLQLEEVYVACLGMMPPSAGCVTAQFSPQCLNHQCQSHLCLSCYGAWAGQEMGSDYKDSVIFDGKHKICGSAHYVASGAALWRRNALSPRNSDTKATCSIFNKILSWNRGGFSSGENELHLEQYKVVFVYKQGDLGIPGLILSSTKLVLNVGLSKMDASGSMITATRGISSSHSSRDTTVLCAWCYKCIADVESDEHHLAVSSLERALGLQIQPHLSANGNERTTVLKEIRFSLAPYVISWCTVLNYRACKCQHLCKLYKFKQDEITHREDILQASVLNLFLTWTVWRCISQSDANCAADLVHEDKIFEVLIIGAGKRCFSLLINDPLCISVLQLDVRDPLVILSIIRPWDPGGVKS